MKRFLIFVSTAFFLSVGLSIQVHASDFSKIKNKLYLREFNTVTPDGENRWRGWLNIISPTNALSFKIYQRYKDKTFFVEKFRNLRSENSGDKYVFTDNSGKKYRREIFLSQDGWLRFFEGKKENPWERYLIDPNQVFKSAEGKKIAKMISNSSSEMDAKKVFDTLPGFLEKFLNTRSLRDTFEQSKNNYDFDSDVVSQVLNYTEYDNETGYDFVRTEKHYFLLNDVAIHDAYARRFQTKDRLQGFWVAVDKKKCLYRKALLSYFGVMVPGRIIDLNKINPKALRFDSYAASGKEIYRVFFNDQTITAISLAQDGRRLQRAWELVYSKYCKGKKSSF